MQPGTRTITTAAQRTENRTVLDVIAGGFLGIAFAWAIPAAMTAAAGPSGLAGPAFGAGLALLLVLATLGATYAPVAIATASLPPLLFGVISLALPDGTLVPSAPLEHAIALMIAGGALLGCGAAPLLKRPR